MNKNGNTSPGKQLLVYFLLVFVLSIPIWLLSYLLGNKLPIPINLPISVFLFVVPVISASILVYRKSGMAGIKALLLKTFDYHKIRNRVWYLPALFLIPLIYLLAYVSMRWVGTPFPDEIVVPLLFAPVFFILYFIGAACEELGWSGYAIDPLQDRWGALKASIILGLIWQIWHIIGDVQANNTANWIFWHSLYSIALRILIVWIYNNTGKSVFAAIMVHTMDNVSWSLFPNFGTAYDPLFTAIFAGLAAVLVIIGWGPQTLARYRFARANR